VSRLFRASILFAALAIVATVIAAGCSYVDPPVLAMAPSSAAEPYYTLTREQMYKELNEAASKTSTTKVSYSTEETSTYLNQKVNDEFLKHYLDEQHIEVTDQDSKLAQQALAGGGQSGQSAQPTPAQVTQKAQLVAINRKLATDAYASGKVDKEQKLREFYDANKAQLETAAEVCIHLIGLQAGTGDGTTPPTEADYTEAQTRAAAVKQRLATETFEAVADSATQLPNPPAGGKVGCIPETRLPQDVLPGIAALAIGATSEPLRTDGGYFIIRVDGRNPATTTPFDQVKEELEAELNQQIGAQLVGQIVGDVLKRTHVTIDPRFGSWDPSKYTVTPPPGSSEPTLPTTTTSMPAGLSLDPSRSGVGSSPSS
jgi:hypothetical protein